MMQRDRERRQRVEELITSGTLQAPEDYFHAAMIFQHGETLEHYWQAHELAKRGAELGHRTSRWLTAAAYDRWLIKQGKPQKYGTQYTSKEGKWVLYEVDPATTDAQRAEWNVPSLAQALQRAEKMNQERTSQEQSAQLGRHDPSTSQKYEPGENGLIRRERTNNDNN